MINFADAPTTGDPNKPPVDSSADLMNPLLVEALERYMQAAEAGQRPARQEFLARYADIAGPLALCLDGLDALGCQPSPSGAIGSQPCLGMDPAIPLGDYRLIRELGRGGMGIVYEAEQLSLGRRVALKVLPFAAMMDKRQLQRFFNEARAAASLEHPHIVPVYGVGCERGVHYYAMRFIEGHSLDTLLHSLRDPAGAAADVPGSPQPDTVRGKGGTVKSSRPNKENFRRIAELAIQAALALEHAHQSGVLHRDVKPANLLLDEEGNLWITDFGLAQIQSDTRLTITGDLVGTLRYMSPEQALAKRVIVDQRTDVYSLGATIYEMLTLRPVFDGQDRQELLRQIAFEEPQPPRRINKGIPAELETIVLKALEKNPDDRYGTARELADDLTRFLHDEPTQARRPTMWQRWRKWTTRHQAIVLATVITLLIGAVGCAWQAVRAYQAEMAAEEDRDQAIEAKKDTLKALVDAQNAKTAMAAALNSTELAQRKAEAVSKFLVDALRSADPEKDGRDVKVVDLLDRAAAEADAKFANDPAVKADLLDALGETYHGLGHYSKAVQLHEKARAIRLELQGNDHPDALKNGNQLSVAYLSSGRRSDALNISKETLERAKAKLGPDHDTTLGAMNNLGGVYYDDRQWADAIACWEYVLNRLEAKLGKGHVDLLLTMDNLACAYADVGRLEEAIALHEAAFQGRKAKLGHDHFFTLHSMNNLAHAYSAAKRRDEAISLYQQTLKLMQVRVGVDHPLRLKCMSNLASEYRDDNRLADAVSLLEEALKGQLLKPGPDHPDTLETMSLLGISYTECGQTGKGIALLEKTLQLGKTKLGADHNVILIAMKLLAQKYQQANQLPKSLALYEEINKVTTVKFGEAHADSQEALKNLARTYSLVKQPLKAVAAYERLLELRRTHLDPDHKETLITMNDLALAYDDVGEESKALSLLDATLDKMKAKLPPGDINTVIALNNLGFRLWRKKDLARSVPLFEEAVKVAKAHLSPDDEYALLSMHNLAVNYLHAGRDAEAVPLFEQVLERRNKVLGPKHADTLGSRDGLAKAYVGAGQFAKAAVLLEKIVEDSKVRLGPGHASTLDAMNRLGVAYWRLKDLDKSVPLFEEARNAAIAHLPADHPLALLIMQNLVVNYRDASRQVDTIAVLDEIVKRRQAKEPLHPQTLASIRELADAYLHAGRFDEPLPLLVETLKLCKAKLNPDHAETQQAMSSLGNAYLQSGRFDEAVFLLEELLKLRTTKLGPENFDTLNTMNTLGMAYRLDGQVEKAQSTFEKTYELNKAKRGLDDPATWQSMRYLSLILMKQGQDAIAEPILRECLDHAKKKQPDAWPTFHNSVLLGMSLLGQEKFADAEKLLVEGYEGIKKREVKIAAFNKALVIEILERIVELYDTADMPELAGKWRTELEDAKARAVGLKKLDRESTKSVSDCFR